ncbi:MAG: DUF481 domain-containing protein [Bryobacterales bacterium]|nr:DUF481 domain-containing protein [Bryobacterales bacterium]
MLAHRLTTSALLALLATPSLGADTVILRNGDRITGTVQRLEEERLIVETAMLGSLRIRWRDVDGIESPEDFSVLTEDGERLDGPLLFEGGRLTVTSVSGGQREVASGDVSRLARGRRMRGVRKVLAVLDGTADFGYSIARGNQSQTQSSAGATAVYSSASYEFAGRLDSLFARQEGTRSQSRHALSTRVDRYLGGRSFSYALGALERNERRRLDLRTRAGGGLGWRVWERRRSSISLLGGLAYVHDRLRDQDNRARAESQFGVDWAARVFGIVGLESHLSVHPNLLDRSHWRVEYDGILRVQVNGRFSYSLRLFDRYDSRPAQGVARNDYGLVSGLGFEF